jgi:hypothetical protein
MSEPQRQTPSRKKSCAKLQSNNLATKSVPGRMVKRLDEKIVKEFTLRNSVVESFSLIRRAFKWHGLGVNTFETDRHCLVSYKQWMTFYQTWLANGQQPKERPRVRKLLTTRASCELSSKLASYCSGRRKKKRCHGVRDVPAIVASMAQAKRGFANLDKSFVQEALEQHSVLLSTPATTDREIIDEVLAYAGDLFPVGWASKWNDGSDLEKGLSNRSISNGLTVRYPDPNEEYFPASSLVRTGPGTISVEERYKARYAEWYQTADDFTVKAVGVQDAGKIRVITKSIKELKVLQPLQYALHTHLKSHYPLMGRELQLNDIQRIVDEDREGIPTSIDYTGATDSLHGDFQKELIEFILDRAGNWRLQGLREIAGRELSLGRVIEYPDRSIRQQRGTLMGSLLSFPLLCLVNGFAMAKHGIKHFLVNGDDGFAMMSNEVYHDWLSTVGRLGLVVNHDKTYRSREYLTINSRYFRISMDHTVHEIPVVVQGAFRSIADGDNFDQLPQRFRSMSLYKRYCRFLPSDRRPLGIPRCLGGLGGDVTTSVEPYHTAIAEWRCAWAHWLCMKPLEVLPENRKVGKTFFLDSWHYHAKSSALQTWSLLEEGFLEKPVKPVRARNYSRLGSDYTIFRKVTEVMKPRFGHQ